MVLAVVCVGCTKPTTTTTTPSRLSFGITSEPPSLCPLFSDSAATAEVQGLLFRELVRSTPAGREPDLAAAIPTLGHGANVAADGTLVVDWTLRADALWQDGTPVTSNDVVAGFKIAADPSQQVLTGATLAQQIERIDVVDATHFRVVWKALQPSFADVRVHRVLPSHLVMNADGTAKNLALDGFCRRPIGNGAFQLVEWTPGAHLLFGRNGRFSPPALLDEVLVKIVPSTDALQSALLAGDVDATFGNGGLAPTEALRASADGKLTTLLAPGTTWVHLDFRLDDPWLKDARLRRALALSLDRRSLVHAIAGDAYDVDDSFFPRSHWAHADTAPIVFDPIESARLLDAAGWTLKPGTAVRTNEAGEALKLELASASGQKDTERLLQMMQGSWAKVGVDVVLDLKPFKVFFGENAKKRKLKHMSFYSWVVDESSIGTALWRGDRIPSEANAFTGQNLPGWKNDEVTRLLEEADASLDVEARKQKLKRVQEVFVDELPALSFYCRKTAVVMRPGVSGLSPTGTLTPLAWNAERWSITR
ncbi:MAG: peptide ABC transporter substrate-binding protein [Deltaproteobacteria bacterium]|nr:peptide ABC transporter substrate-binding protein [Deltaproteobacteria bacterium]